MPRKYSSTRLDDFVRKVRSAGARPYRAFDPLLALWSTPDPAGQYMDPYGFGGDPVNAVDLYGLWKIGLGITIGWDNKSGFSMGFGVAADIDRYSNVDLSATHSFGDGSWTYTAGGSVNVNVCGWNLYGGGSYSYNTSTGSTVSGFSGANYMGYGGGETGGSLYWDKSGNYQGATLYQEFYGGAFGFRSGTGYEWGFGGMEGRGWYQEASGYGLYASYSQNGGLSYGGKGTIQVASYNSAHPSGISKEKIQKAIDMQNEANCGTMCEVYFSDKDDPILVWRTGDDQNSPYPDLDAILSEGATIIGHTHSAEDLLIPSGRDGVTAFDYSDKNYVMVNAATKKVYLYEGTGSDPNRGGVQDNIYSLPPAKVTQTWTSNQSIGWKWDLAWKYRHY